MSLRIERISVRNLGPIEELDEPLGDLNLIYGLNESGKTFLVEFIISSLFKKKQYWGQLRDLNCQGRVYVSGLSEAPVAFSPASGRRHKGLADYLKEPEAPFNLSLLKTLIVRAGDVRIGPEGLSKDVLKEVFFQRNFYTGLLNDKDRLPRTAQTATIEEDGTIIVDRRGDRDRAELRAQLNRIDTLIRNFQHRYDRARLRQLQLKKQALEARREALRRARRYRAFVLAGEIEDIKTQLSRLPEEQEIERLQKDLERQLYLQELLKNKNAQLKALEPSLKKLQEVEVRFQKQRQAKAYMAWRLSTEIRALEAQLQEVPAEAIQQLQIDVLKFKELQRHYRQKLSEVEVLQQRVRHLEFLRSAERRYQELLQGKGAGGVLQWASWIGSTVLVAAGLWGFLNDMDIVGVGLLGAGLALAGFGVYSLVKASPGKREIESLRDRIEQFFGHRVSTLAEIEALRQQLERHQIQIEEKRLPETEKELEKLRGEIELAFQRLYGQAVPADRWDQVVEELKHRHRRLSSELDEIRQRFHRLNVPEIDYVDTDPGEPYEPELFRELEKQVSELLKTRAKAEALREEIDSLRVELEAKEEILRKRLQEIFPGELPAEQWQDQLQALFGQVRQLNRALTEKQTELKGLNVPEDGYLKEDPQVPFEPEALEQTEEQLRSIDEEINEVKNTLSELKGQICNETGIDLSSDWDTLIDSLYALREETLENLKAETTTLVARILLAKEIQRLQQEEDAEIEQLLNSEQVREFLQRVTGRYRSITIDGESFYVSDGYNTFDFNDLSTGAQEQVLLALRMAMLYRLSGQQNMFIILDDAFQHVDWQRRPLLVESLIEVVKQGWQVIYLTMDDHIRDLFHKHARILGEGYRFFDLKALAEDQKRLF